MKFRSKLKQEKQGKLTVFRFKKSRVGDRTLPPADELTITDYLASTPEVEDEWEIRNLKKNSATATWEYSGTLGSWE